MSHRMLNPQYLRTTQYQNDSQLQKRIEIHRRFGTNSQPLYHWLFGQIHFPPKPHVLEIGCGNGSFWLANAEALPEHIELTLTDLSAGMLADARNRLVDVLPHTALVADAQKLPFDDASFDIVIANYMLYHVPDTRRAIREIRRVLKSSGTLYAATNGVDHMHELLELAPDYRDDDPVTRQFALENGKEQLAESFANIDRHDFIDHLEITEVQPVIDYLASASDDDTLSGMELERITTFVEDRIRQNGAFRVHKSTGLFTASGSTSS